MAIFKAGATKIAGRMARYARTSGARANPRLNRRLKPRAHAYGSAAHPPGLSSAKIHTIQELLRTYQSFSVIEYTWNVEFSRTGASASRRLASRSVISAPENTHKLSHVDKCDILSYLPTIGSMWNFRGQNLNTRRLV